MPEEKTNAEVVEELVSRCMAEVAICHEEKYDAEKAERTAALFLDARMKLAMFIEEIELNAKQSKTEIDRVEAEKYFEYRDSFNGGKITEAVLSNSVAKDKSVVESKRSWAQAEASLKKYNYLMDSLKDGLYLFKNIGKNNNGF